MSISKTDSVGADASLLGDISNSVIVSLTTDDPNFGNNSISETITVVDVADLSISKFDEGHPIGSGGNQQLIYTVSVYNAGPSETP